MRLQLMVRFGTAATLRSQLLAHAGTAVTPRPQLVAQAGTRGDDCWCTWGQNAQLLVHLGTEYHLFLS